MLCDRRGPNHPRYRKSRIRMFPNKFSKVLIVEISEGFSSIMYDFVSLPRTTTSFYINSKFEVRLKFRIFI